MPTEMVLIEHLKEDWVYLLPFRLRNNRYRGLSRPSYQLFAILYYIVKTIVIIALCGYYYILAGVCVVIKWIWKKSSKPKIANMEQKDTLGIKLNNIDNAKGKRTYPAKKQPSTGINRKPATVVSQPVVPREGAINHLWNHGSEAAWHEALEHYYDLLNADARELDSYMENVDANDIAQLSVAGFYDFLYDRYFVWKYTAKNRLATTRKSLRRYVDEEKLHELADIQSRLFLADHANIAKCLSIVTEIRGLGPAGASGLLSILFPEEFGTIDQFVVKALREVDGLPYAAELAKMKPESLSVENGVLLIRILREKAEKLNKRFDTDFWTPRKIDTVLWAIGR